MKIIQQKRFGFIIGQRPLVTAWKKKHGAELAFGYVKRLKDVAEEERRKNNFPAYDTILNAVNETFSDELSAEERVIFFHTI